MPLSQSILSPSRLPSYHTEGENCWIPNSLTHGKTASMTIVCATSRLHPITRATAPLPVLPFLSVLIQQPDLRCITIIFRFFLPHIVSCFMVRYLRKPPRSLKHRCQGEAGQLSAFRRFLQILHPTSQDPGPFLRVMYVCAEDSI